jgi:hypothetical protein
MAARESAAARGVTAAPAGRPGAAEHPRPGPVRVPAGVRTGRPGRTARWLWAAGLAVAGAALFTAYLRLSNTYPEDSDQANLGLQAWDMLHGNLLLHGWMLSDVSFYTTELPQYMLLELIGGLNTGTFHAAAAMTYTLALLLAAMLAKGRASGRRGVLRALIAGGIMLAPQLGSGVFILLLTVGHLGTSVPLLVTWLVLDRARPGWRLAVATGLLLTWGAVADSLVLAVGSLPLALVCGLRIIQGMFGSPPPADPAHPASASGGVTGRLRHALGTRRFEVYLAAAAAGSAVASQLLVRLIHALGGYTLHAVTFTIEPAGKWAGQVAGTWRGLLLLFGADTRGLPPGYDRDVALLHLAGVALVALALVLAAWIFTRATLVDQVLATAIAINVVLYVISNMPSLNAHEMAIVLPCGAALAGRMLVRLTGSAAGPTAPDATAGPLAAAEHGAATGHGRLINRRLITRVARAAVATTGVVVLAGYLAGLGREVRHPAVAAQNTQIASWLAAHHLTYGLGGYWESSIVTVDTASHVRVRALMQFTMRRDLWESKYAWYVPHGQYANFVVFESVGGFYYHWEPRVLVHRYFGDPARTYNVGPWTVMVWDRNLLPDIPGNPS